MGQHNDQIISKIKLPNYANPFSIHDGKSYHTLKELVDDSEKIVRIEKFPVGGKIFYIDETATGAEYIFCNSNGSILSDIRVGDEPAYYIVNGTPDKDKYYIFNSETVYEKKSWTYKDQNDNWVNELTGISGTALGMGKANTQTILSKDGGAYANYLNTIWNQIKYLNDNRVNNCDDWYVPTVNELESLRLATDRYGTLITNLFVDRSFFTSSETDASAVRRWVDSSQSWGTTSKTGLRWVLPIRSF